jgi:hypothetical protein
VCTEVSEPYCWYLLSRGWRPGETTLKRFFAHLIAAIVVTFGTASLAPAEILIGMPGPLTGGVAWFGEQMQEGIGMKGAKLNAAGGVLGVEKVRYWLRLLRKSDRTRDLGPALDGLHGVLPPEPIG